MANLPGIIQLSDLANFTASSTAIGLIQLAGDLGGVASSPLVTGLQGVEVSSALPILNRVLTYNGTQWVAAEPAVSGDIRGSILNATVVAIQGVGVTPYLATHGTSTSALNPSTNITSVDSVPITTAAVGVIVDGLPLPFVTFAPANNPTQIIANLQNAINSALNTATSSFITQTLTTSGPPTPIVTLAYLPTNIPAIPGYTYTTGIPGHAQFAVNFSTGVITFHADAHDTVVNITYTHTLPTLSVTVTYTGTVPTNFYTVTSNSIGPSSSVVFIPPVFPANLPSYPDVSQLLLLGINNGGVEVAGTTGSIPVGFVLTAGAGNTASWAEPTALDGVVVSGPAIAGQTIITTSPTTATFQTLSTNNLSDKAAIMRRSANMFIVGSGYPLTADYPTLSTAIAGIGPIGTRNVYITIQDNLVQGLQSETPITIDAQSGAVIISGQLGDRFSAGLGYNDPGAAITVVGGGVTFVNIFIQNLGGGPCIAFTGQNPSDNLTLTRTFLDVNLGVVPYALTADTHGQLTINEDSFIFGIHFNGQGNGDSSITIDHSQVINVNLPALYIANGPQFGTPFGFSVNFSTLSSFGAPNPAIFGAANGYGGNIGFNNLNGSTPTSNNIGTNGYTIGSIALDTNPGTLDVQGRISSTGDPAFGGAGSLQVNSQDQTALFELIANNGGGGLSLHNDNNGQDVIHVDPNAPGAIFIDSNGKVDLSNGLNVSGSTQLDSNAIHTDGIGNITTTGNNVQIQPSSGNPTFSLQAPGQTLWSMGESTSDGSLYFKNNNNGGPTINISPLAPTNSLVMNPDGSVVVPVLYATGYQGIQVVPSSGGAILVMKSSDGTSQFYLNAISSSGGFSILNNVTGLSPFAITENANNNSLIVDQGRIIINGSSTGGSPNGRLDLVSQSGPGWDLITKDSDGTFHINFLGSGSDQFKLDSAGNLTILGDISAAAVHASNLMTRDPHYYIVGPTGDYVTLSAAFAAHPEFSNGTLAVATTIAIQEGTYAESPITVWTAPNIFLGITNFGNSSFPTLNYSSAPSITFLGGGLGISGVVINNTSGPILNYNSSAATDSVSINGDTILLGPATGLCITATSTNPLAPIDGNGNSSGGKLNLVGNLVILGGVSFANRVSFDIDDSEIVCGFVSPVAINSTVPPEINARINGSSLVEFSNSLPAITATNPVTIGGGFNSLGGSTPTDANVSFGGMTIGNVPVTSTPGSLLVDGNLAAQNQLRAANGNFYVDNMGDIILNPGAGGGNVTAKSYNLTQGESLTSVTNVGPDNQYYLSISGANLSSDPNFSSGVIEVPDINPVTAGAGNLVLIGSTGNHIGPNMRGIINIAVQAVANVGLAIPGSGAGNAGSLIGSGGYTDSLVGGNIDLSTGENFGGASFGVPNPPTTSTAGGETLTLSINGETPFTITFGVDANGIAIAADIQAQVRAHTADSPSNQFAYNGFTALYRNYRSGPNPRYLLSAPGDPFILNPGSPTISSVVVTTGLGSPDIAAGLQLGVANGGQEFSGGVGTFNLTLGQGDAPQTGGNLQFGGGGQLVINSAGGAGGTNPDCTISLQASNSWTLNSSFAGSSLQFVDDSTGNTPVVIEQGSLNDTLRVKASGQVGIGNSSPSYKLDVAGDINTTGIYRVNGTPGVSGTFTTADSKTVTVTNGIITSIV